MACNVANVAKGFCKRILTDARSNGTLCVLISRSTVVTLSPCHAFLAWTLSRVLIANLSHRSVRVAVTCYKGNMRTASEYLFFSCVCSSIGSTGGLPCKKARGRGGFAYERVGCSSLILNLLPKGRPIMAWARISFGL